MHELFCCGVLGRMHHSRAENLFCTASVAMGLKVTQFSVAGNLNLVKGYNQIFL